MSNSRLRTSTGGPHLYFAYGSNLNRADMRVRCPGAKPLTRANLDGWRLTFRGVADVEPASGRSALGALWLLGDADLTRLDRYEGAPVHYRRMEVEASTPDGPMSALTYVMCDTAYLGLPSEWYFDRIAEGYRDWLLPVGPLHRTRDEVRQRLAALGATRFEPQGRKRLRAIVDTER